MKSSTRSCYSQQALLCLAHLCLALCLFLASPSAFFLCLSVCLSASVCLSLKMRTERNKEVIELNESKTQKGNTTNARTLSSSSRSHRIVPASACVAVCTYTYLCVYLCMQSACFCAFVCMYYVCICFYLRISVVI